MCHNADWLIFNLMVTKLLFFNLIHLNLKLCIYFLPFSLFNRGFLNNFELCWFSIFICSLNFCGNKLWTHRKQKIWFISKCKKHMIHKGKLVEKSVLKNSLNIFIINQNVFMFFLLSGYFSPMLKVLFYEFADAIKKIAKNTRYSR